MFVMYSVFLYLAQAIIIGIGISTMKILVLVSVSGIGESEKYRYQWIICIRQWKILVSISMVLAKLKSLVLVIGFFRVCISIGFRISPKPKSCAMFSLDL